MCSAIEVVGADADADADADDADAPFCRLRLAKTLNIGRMCHGEQEPGGGQMQGGETRSNRYRYATSSCYEGSQMATGSHQPDLTSSPCGS